MCWLHKGKWCLYALVKYTIIGSFNGLLSVWCQTIIWTNADFSCQLDHETHIYMKFYLKFIERNLFENVIYKSQPLLQCVKWLSSTLSYKILIWICMLCGIRHVGLHNDIYSSSTHCQPEPNILISITYLEPELNCVWPSYDMKRKK